MKTAYILSTALIFSLSYTTSLMAQDSNGDEPGGGHGHGNKVTICHVPPGNPANAHTITVSRQGADAHLRQHSGDYEGACRTDTTTTPPGECTCDYNGDGLNDLQSGASFSNGPVTAWFNATADTVTIDSKKEMTTVLITLSDETVLTYANQKTKQATYVLPEQYTGLQIFDVNVMVKGSKESYAIANEVAQDPEGLCECDTGGIPFPVKMVSFEAHKIGDNQVELKWRTASEENNDHISIEKTYDNESWKEVCRVPGHGTTQQVHDYSCVDNNAIENGENVAYYRPKQVDYNGTYAYFNTIRIRLLSSDQNTAIENVYPNPATDRLYIKYRSTDNDQFNIRLLSLDGKELIKQQYIGKKGEQTMDLDIAEGNLSTGFYILEVENNGQIYRNKIYKK
jgi:hypothetical protein